MRNRRHSQGFTLIELLVVAGVGSLLIGAVATVLVSQLRVQQQMEGRNRLQERWARISFLLDQEIQEAHTVTVVANGLRLTVCEPLAVGDFYAASPSRCSDGPSGQGTPGNDITIEYALSGNVISRTGPDINAQGQLVADTFNTHALSSGVSAFTPTPQADGTVDYTLTLVDPNNPAGQSFSKSGTARARTQRL